MAVTVTVEVVGGDKLVATMGDVAAGVKDLGTSMAAIGLYLRNFYSGEVFASRGGVIGEPWQPLNDRYAAYKARKWPGRIPLIRTGLMNNSFTSQTGTDFARISNTAEYFKYQQQGTSRIPARVMLKLDETRQQEVIRIIDAEITATIRGAGA